MEEIRKNLTPYFSFIYILFFLLVFLIMGFQSFLHPEKLLNYDLNSISNDYCKKYNLSMNEIEKTACENKYKKSKIIYLQFDGISNDQLHEIINFDKHKIAHFKTVKLTGYKKSPRCHEMHFTGHFSRNIHHFPVKKDNILLQMKNIGMNVFYSGENKPLFYIFSQQNVFDSFKIFNKSQIKFPFFEICSNLNVSLFRSKELNENLMKFSDKIGKIKSEFLIKNDSFVVYDEIEKFINKDSMNVLNCDEFMKILHENKSLFYYYSADEINHDYFKYHWLNYESLFIIENMLVKFIEFVDNNPEYILVSSSDHGGQTFYGEDNYMNHGSDEFTNYPFHFFYTKELKENYNEWKKGIQNITVEKIAPTLAQLITGINIPLEATDFPLTIGNDKIFRMAACKSKEFQLRSFMEKYTEKYKKYKNIFNDIINKLNNSDFVTNEDQNKFDDENYKEKYFDFLQEIQNEILITVYNVHKESFFGFFLKMVFCFFLYFIFYNTSNLYKKLYEKKDFSFFNIFFILMIFFFLNFDNFFLIFNNEKIHKILIKSRIENYIIISLFLLIIIIKEKIFFKEKLFLYFIHLIIIIIFSFFTKKFDFFIKMKIFFNYPPFNKIIDLIINVPISFLLTNFMISNFKSYYFKNKKNNIYFLFAILNLFFHVFVFIYDLNSHNFLKERTNFIFYFVIFPILLIIFVCFVLFCFPYYLKLNNAFINENEVLFKKEFLFPLLKIVYYYYHFYISDMNEKFFLVIFIIPFLEFSVYLYNKNEEKINKYKILYILMIILHNDLSFILFQKFYSYDVTLKETLNKTIGLKLEKTFPKIGGIIIASHIMKYYLLLSFYLISLFKLEFNKFINNDTNIIFVLLKIQLCSVLATLFVLINKKGVKNDDVMDAFILTVAKISVFLLCDCFFLILLCLLNVKNKNDEKVDSKKEGLITNDNSDSNENDKQYLKLNQMNV